MSFKVIPTGIPTPTGEVAPSAPLTPRQRAINAFNAAQASGTPPQPTSPEEYSAVRQQSKALEQASSGQEHTSEAPIEQPASEEAPKEVTEARKEEPLSNQYAILARKEKALRAKIQAQEATTRSKEAELKAREEALELRNNSTKSEYEQKFVSKDKLMENPLQILAELGMTYDQLTQAAMNAPKPEDVARDQYIKKLEAKLDALETGQKKVLETFEETQQNNYKQALNQIRIQAETLVKNDPSYETIAAYGKPALDEVVDLIEKTWTEDNILLDVEDAAKEVEEELTNRALKIARLKKIQQRIGSSTSTSNTKQATPASEPKTTAKTLTNQMSASKPLSARERAILAFKGELKN